MVDDLKLNTTNATLSKHRKTRVRARVRKKMTTALAGIREIEHNLDCHFVAIPGQDTNPARVD
jgi:hypothetical protein